MTRLAVIGNACYMDLGFEHFLMDQTSKYLTDHYAPRFLMKRSDTIDFAFMHEMAGFAKTFKGRTTIILMLGNFDAYMCIRPIAIASCINVAINRILEKKMKKTHLLVTGLIPPFDDYLKPRYAEADNHIATMIAEHKANKRLTYVNLAEELTERKSYKRAEQLSDYGIAGVIAKLLMALDQVPDRH